MTGSNKVLELLNDLLAGEMVAITTYILHSEMFDNWGFKKIAGLLKKNAMDEMKHAERYIERILNLDGLPEITMAEIKSFADARALFFWNLELETDTVNKMNGYLADCRSEGDNVTGELLEDIIEDENRHAQFLEEQISLIDKIGNQNYLASVV